MIAAMSKNKENTSINVPQQPQHVNGLKSHYSVTRPGDEFFTDSILESDTTQSSRIPTPRPQKAVQARSKRSRPAKSKSYPQPPRHRASASESSVPQLQQRNLQPALPIRRSKSPSPLRSLSISTPPSLRNRLPLISPHSDVRSPPPRELPDVYQQIADEEDLAATEREYSDPEEFPEDSDDDRAVQSNHLILPQRPSFAQRDRSPSSRASTPTQQTNPIHHSAHISQRTESLSEASGISFLNQLTDQDLAAKMTPHFVQSARDQAKVQQWSNTKPIPFSKAATRSDGAASTKPVPTQIATLTAFSKAVPRTRPDLTAAQQGGVDRPQSRRSDGSIENLEPLVDDWEQVDRPRNTLPLNRGIKRDLKFSRNFGFQMPRPALTEQNLEQQNRIGRSETGNHSAPSSLASHHSSPTDLVNLEDRIRKVRSSLSQLLGGARREEGEKEGLDQQEQKQQPQPVPLDASEAQHVAVTADAAKVSLKQDLISPSEESVPVFKGVQLSPEKTKKWDLDFTGQSFQVSESPPVRATAPLRDNSLGKEIENLSRKALATNRLGEIRERHSQEQLRGSAISPVPKAASIRSTSVSSEPRRSSFRRSNEDVVLVNGDPVPDTPIVVYRTSSNGNSHEKSSGHDNQANAAPDDLLQRFARASSSTPRSSPALSRDLGDKNQSTQASSKSDRASESDRKTIGQPNTIALEPKTVAQTPRVVGAWTDTILPETAKTTRHSQPFSQYLQTPHVSAGGWIETPGPVESKVALAEMAPIIEVPEELIEGIVVRPKLEPSLESDNSEKREPNPPGKEGGSFKVGIAEDLLGRARQKANSDQAAALRGDDTLNIGNDTIDSLRQWLGLAAQDLTEVSMIQLPPDAELEAATEQGQDEALARLTSRIERIHVTLKEARKGISTLEHHMSQTAELDTSPDLTAAHRSITNASAPDTHQQSKLIHTTQLKFSVPIPLLFYPKSTDAAATRRFSLPRPTPLGYLTMTLWLWYMLETAMSEIYSRPAYAERYVWPVNGEREPEFPFVLPTMILRWLKLEYVSLFAVQLFGWLWTILRAVYRFFAVTSGWNDGFTEPLSAASKAAAATAQKAATSTIAAVSGMETDLSMMNDEFL